MKFLELNDRLMEAKVKRGLNRFAILLSALISALVSWLSYEVRRPASEEIISQYVYFVFPLFSLILYAIFLFAIIPALRWVIKGFLE